MVTTRRKVPAHPPAPLHRRPGDVLTIQPVLWRLHRTRGPFVLPWNGFRIFGPLTSARWDPHPSPQGEHPGSGVSYAAIDLRTAVAEVFQTARRVTASDEVQATSWTPTRSLCLLDLTGDWALRSDAAHALAAAPRRVCRTWSQAIRSQWPDLDGLWAPSTLTGSPVVTLYEPAADTFPPAPAFSRPLSASLLWSLVADAAESIGYEIG
ncbi:RES family NAD+ phosphorylase [Nakamurella leprariae]|uniref:RES family NAD+ phosphorylase n=1 Tax=Nakamurella leprariae TaxID=2803911 RepID=A0A938YIE1_9ACTN|nr:RES family NAD+ phosphorylase [Nakamurella leprariae]MBM9468408.1 RES family NAD+ phosphorylase [Nakamurella leprariae]